MAALPIRRCETSAQCGFAGCSWNCDLVFGAGLSQSPTEFAGRQVKLIKSPIH